MGKKATTIPEQIQKLKDRGMHLNLGEDKAKEVLLDVGYYRMGFYWHPLEKDNDHNFKAGAKFSDALDLYYLDSDLRHVFIKFLNRIEVNFKTKLIYEASNHYQTKPTWFADPSIMKKGFISQLPKYYDERFKNNNTALRNHHKKYINQIYAPAWKALEFMPFGSILTIYMNLKSEELQKKICKHYDLRNQHYFVNHIRNLIAVRNICAHGGQLFDLQLAKANTDIYGLKFSGKEKNNLYGVFKLIKYYLSKISSDREVEFNTKVLSLLQVHQSNTALTDIIETKAGFLSF
jgi:abortive infection bacteriophage resistance protein